MKNGKVTRPHKELRRGAKLNKKGKKKTITLYQIRSDQSLSHVRLFGTPWTAAYQAPLSMEFSRQEYWSGVPLPSPGSIPSQEIKIPHCVAKNN